MILPVTPSSKFALVTPSDTAILEYQGDVMATKAILLEVAGDLAVKDDKGTTVIIPGLAAGVMHPIEVSRVMSTGTAATGITAFY